jgi:uncharacterized DUF497 family protein
MVQFDWDERKEAVNRAKHSVSFEEAATALEDPGRVSRLDRNHAETEERLLTIGFSYRQPSCRGGDR